MEEWNEGMNPRGMQAYRDGIYNPNEDLSRPEIYARELESHAIFFSIICFPWLIIKDTDF